MDFDTVAFIVIGIVIVIVIGFVIWGIFYPSISGNKILLDTQYKFEKAITYLNGEKMELEIDKWSDYEGEQIQIITKDGTVYLLSSFNTILIGK